MALLRVNFWSQCGQEYGRSPKWIAFTCLLRFEPFANVQRQWGHLYLRSWDDPLTGASEFGWWLEEDEGWALEEEGDDGWLRIKSIECLEFARGGDEPGTWAWSICIAWKYSRTVCWKPWRRWSNAYIWERMMRWIYIRWKWVRRGGESRREWKGRRTGLVPNDFCSCVGWVHFYCRVGWVAR